MPTAKLSLPVEHVVVGPFDPRAEKGTRLTEYGDLYATGASYTEADEAMRDLIARHVRRRPNPTLHVVSPTHQIIVWETPWGVTYQHYRDGGACGTTITSGTFDEVLRHLQDQYPANA